MKKIGKKLSEIAIMGSMEVWRRYGKDMPHEENIRIRQMAE
jgi:hypothetical protein